MPHKDGLSERDGVGDLGNRGVCPVRVGCAFLVVVAEPVGPLLGALDQTGIFVVDFAREFEEQVFPLRRPGGGHEQPLFGGPDEPGSADAIVYVAG